MRCRVRTRNFFSQNDKDTHEHHPGVEECRDSDPIPAFEERIDRSRVEGAIEQRVDPDGHLPPLRARHQERVEGAPVPVDEPDQRFRRPEGLPEVKWVGDDDLFYIDNIRDEKEIDQKEPHKDPVHPALREGNRLWFHTYL